MRPVRSESGWLDGRLGVVFGGLAEQLILKFLNPKTFCKQLFLQLLDFSGQSAVDTGSSSLLECGRKKAFHTDGGSLPLLCPCQAFDISGQLERHLGDKRSPFFFLLFSR